MAIIRYNLKLSVNYKVGDSYRLIYLYKKKIGASMNEAPIFFYLQE